jgi:Tol biopolymer transport system component
VRVTPGKPGADDFLSDALTPRATSDARTIVFVSPAGGRLGGLWTADASGRPQAQLAQEATADQVVITPDDRSVLYLSIAGGTVSTWMVPIAGGKSTKVVDGGSVAVSSNGRSLAFVAEEGEQVKQVSLFVCAFPACSSRRRIGPASFDSPLAWAPGDRGLAFARDGNLWVQPLDGGEPRQLTRFADRRPIESFAWSHDGTRLALTKSTVSNDIVLIKGLPGTR